ncbi:hypothetical protein [Hyphomonas sp.]|uniref:hypothetical protein n=1 Tax=Hyphomonas sp. TaxID=87 RepID=UPI00391AB68B
MQRLAFTLAAMCLATGSALANEDCRSVRFSPEAGALYLPAEKSVLNQDTPEGLRLISELKQLPLSRCERVAALRLEMLALNFVKDHSTALDRAIEVFELDHETVMSPERSVRPVVIFLQKLGRVTEAERWAEDAGLDWPILYSAIEIWDPGPRLPEPVMPMQVSYPEAAGGREGFCQASYIVAETGIPRVTQLECSDPVFSEAAEAAAESMRYLPEDVEALSPRRPTTRVAVVFRPDQTE